MFESHGESTRSTYIKPKAAGVMGSWLIKDLAVRLPSHALEPFNIFALFTHENDEPAQVEF